MRKLFLVLFAGLSIHVSNAQRSVSITIDDVPNTQLYRQQNFSSSLLRKLDSLQVPVAIFINEGNLKQTKNWNENKKLLRSWLLKSYVTAGNHGFAHKNYTEVGLDALKEEVLKGEVITRSIVKETGKELKYFRFPFNAAGKDSLEHLAAQNFLKEKHYIATPFTVESEDYIYAILYEKAQAENDHERAKWVGDQYVDYTMRLFAYFDSLSISQYNRSIHQVFLCHDNQLNADYLPGIVDALKKRDYQLISLDHAMLDPVYQSQMYYYGKAGFSWIYRWIPEVDVRKKRMRSEPGNSEIQKALADLKK